MKSDHLLWRKPPTMVGLGVAGLSVAVALIGEWWLETVLHAAAHVSLFLCAVILSAWLGGNGPGLLAIALSALALDYFFMSPTYSLAVATTELPRLLLYVLSALFAGLLSAAQRNSAESLSRTNKALQAENRERRRAEDRLREQARLLDLTHDTIFVRDMSDVITYWNRGAEEFYGWKKEEAIGQVSHRLTQTTFPVPLERITAQLLRTERWEGELIQRKRDGTEVAVTSRWALQRDGSANPVAVLETNTDITERKHAEEALRRSEAYLIEAQRLSRAGSWAIDPIKGEIIHASEELYRSWGLDQERGVKSMEVFHQRVHPEDRHRYVSAIETAKHEKTDMEVEYRAVLPDGTIKQMHTVAHPVFNPSGDLIEIVGTSLDITERKLAEEAVRVATARFKDILEISHDAIISVDSRQRIILFSQGAERLFGFTQADVIGSHLERLLPDDVREVHRQHIEEFGRSRDVARTIGQKRTVYGHRKGGSQFLAEASISKLDVGADRVYTVILRDITERKRMEQALRENEARLQAILDHSPAPIFLKDLAGRYVLVNRQFEKITHLLPEQVVTKTDEEIFSPEQAAAFRANDLEVLRADTPMQFEEIALHDDGPHTSIVFKFPLKDAEGETYAVGGIATDITRHMQAESALRMAEADLARVNRLATLGALTASIAHEVNQPLAAMVTSAATCSRWLAAQPPDLRSAQRALDRIVRDGNRASEVVARIRGLVQRQLPRRGMVDLNQTILEVLALVRGEIQSNGVSLKVELAKDLPPVLGDRVQLQQVILNLIVNAMEAMSVIDDPPRELGIDSGRDESSGVIIAVRDSGMGVDPTDIDQLFEAFYTTKPDGIGMGLTISRAIVEAHGGRLWAEANVPHGTVFHFSLPADTRRHSRDEGPASRRTDNKPVHHV